MKQVEFYFDLVSPYSYPAHAKISRVCRAMDAELVLRPILLGAVFNETGGRAATEVPAKYRYMLRDLSLLTESQGTPLRFPDPFPFRSLKTMRAALWLRPQDLMYAFVSEAFSLYWAEGGSPKGRQEADEDPAISEVARRIDVSLESVLEGVSRQPAKDALRAATTEALERGVFSAPTFFMGDEMFWGNDRITFVEAALKKG